MATEFFFLGGLEQIVTSRGKFDFPSATYMLLAEAENADYLVGIQREEVSSLNAEPSKNVCKKYFDFNGREYRQTAQADIEIPEGRAFAKAISITYHSSKLHGGGDGKPTHFVHKFGKNVYLWFDQNSATYLIAGGNMTVTDRGIVD